MTGVSLTPDAALAWLVSLSADLRGVALLDGAGALLGGDAGLGRRAAAALAADPGAREVADGDLLAVRSARHVVAAAIGPRALRRLTLADLRAALSALEAE
jgi:hypothetical protein